MMFRTHVDDCINLNINTYEDFISNLDDCALNYQKEVRVKGEVAQDENESTDVMLTTPENAFTTTMIFPILKPKSSNKSQKH